MKIDDKQVHIQSFITDDLLVYYDSSNIATFDTNKYGQLWALCARVVVTRDVEERLDKTKSDDYIIGHFTVEVKPTSLEELSKNIDQHKKALIEKIRQLVSDGSGLHKITECPIKYIAEVN